MTEKDRLPPRARAKILTLAEAETSMMTAMHATQAQIKEFDEALAMTSENQRKLDLTEMIAQRREVNATQQARHRALADLNGKIRRYLDMLPADMVVEDAKRPKIKLKNETHQQAIASLRGQIMKLIAERSQVERAALPTDEIKAQAKRWIVERALKGRPTITAGHDKFDIVFSAMKENAYTPTLDVFALLAWYDPEYLEDKLNTVIDEMPRPTFALSPSEKAQRLAEIKAELADAERMECALIDDAQDNGIIIDHRPNVSVPALLGLTVSKKSAKAA